MYAFQINQLKIAILLSIKRILDQYIRTIGIRVMGAIEKNVSVVEHFRIIDHRNNWFI